MSATVKKYTSKNKRITKANSVRSKYVQKASKAHKYYTYKAIYEKYGEV